ncbi:hypothetical protein KEJ15_01190 [Candidatus Bathyarchaeota archaeon]|nr:hypothetical protein [Candidatus Bathyarchaeota archaeon]
MKRLRKIGAILGVKGLLCLASLTMIALALVTYTASVTITPTIQFSIGATSDSWAVYVNDVDKFRYLPGGVAEPTFDANNPNTYAFKVVTDANQVCAVKIELTSAVNSSKFSKFQITVKYWTGAAWADETLYDAPTGSTTKAYINGLTPGDVGYVHQGLSTTRYYLIKVTYSYDLVDETTQITATFQYTPLPQNSF